MPKKRFNHSIVDIDENQLHIEWLTQAKLTYNHALDLAEAKKELNSAKAALALTKAEMDKKIREDPKSYDLKKVSEKSVELCVLQQMEVQDLVDYVIECQYAVDILEAAMAGLNDKKKALENLVTLYLVGYYAGPKTPKVGKEELEELVKEEVRKKGRKRVDPD